MLDLAQNAISARANTVTINIDENLQKNFMSVSIADDGCGMSPDFVKNVMDPFVTTRTTRKVGMGISFFKMAAEMTGGEMSIISEEGIGTTVIATFNTDHIDFVPLGDIMGTVVTLVMCNPDMNFEYKHSIDNREMLFSTEKIRLMLGGEVSLAEPEILVWIKEYLIEQYNLLTEERKHI